MAKSSERITMISEAGYRLAKRLGSHRLVTFKMVAPEAGCSVSLCRSYLINLSGLRAAILRVAKAHGDKEMLKHAKGLEKLEKVSK